MPQNRDSETSRFYLAWGAVEVLDNQVRFSFKVDRLNAISVEHAP